MLYGDEKSFEMARSLLPSQARHSARAYKRHISRKARRSARQELRALGEEWLDEQGPELARRREMSRAVNSRRHHDKVNPFIRWATEVTRAMPRQNRLSYARTLVPEGLIGQHALSHLRWAHAFRPERELRERDRRRRSDFLDRGEQAELLRRIVESSEAYRALNQRLRGVHDLEERRRYQLSHGRPAPAQWRPPVRARLLLGVHDVLPFLDALEVARGLRPCPFHPPGFTCMRGRHPEAYVALDAFLRAFKMNGHAASWR